MPKFTNDIKVIQASSSIKDKFKQHLKEKEEEKKLLATKLALNEMKLNNWVESAAEWEEVYQQTYIEKMMFVEMYYDIKDIKGIAEELKKGQQKILTNQGLIIKNTGEILKNQEIIIKNQEIIIATTGEILGKVNEIADNVEEIKTKLENAGYTVKVENGGNNGSGLGSVAGKNNMLLYGGIGLAALIVILVIIKKMKK